MRVISRRAIEFACNSKACAPPPVGTGGSGGGGSKRSYASDKLKAAGASGPHLDIEWAPQSEGSLTLKGVVTTTGGRKFAVEWDEFDIGPKTADQIIDQYAKLLDTYPDAPAIPLALGLDAAKNMFSKVYSDDPYYVNQLDGLHERATGYVVNDLDTKAPLMMAYSNVIDDRRSLLKIPESWGQGTRGLTNDQAREYIVSHEFGHVVQQHAMSRMTQGQRTMLDLDASELRGKKAERVVDIGNYGRSNNAEMFAESFAVQTHGLVSKDGSFLRDVTDPYLGGSPPRQVEWTS